MADSNTPFNDPEILCLSVSAIRHYWSLLLQDCTEKHAQEHPLYGLFSSILSTLSKTISISGRQVSPTSIDDSIIFAYPQCRVVDKKAVGDSEHDSISAYPDFGLIQLTTKQSPNGKVKVERARLLVEIKRLYRTNHGCLWIRTNGDDRNWAINKAVRTNLRQLLLQAYCSFRVYEQSEVFIMLIPGVYFTLFKFTRPNSFEPLPQAPATNKKRKLEVEEITTEEPDCRVAKEISDTQLAKLIPLECVKVIYHGAPVFDDVQAEELRLSNAFRQALRERLDDINFQPCSLFDLCAAQYVPEERHKEVAIEEISWWYSEVQARDIPKTPKKSFHPYVEGPEKDGDKATPTSPEYKGKTASEIGRRSPLQRESKDRTNLLRQYFGDEGSGEGAPDAVGDMGSDNQKWSEDSDGEDR